MLFQFKLLLSHYIITFCHAFIEQAEVTELPYVFECLCKHQCLTTVHSILLYGSVTIFECLLLGFYLLTVGFVKIKMADQNCIFFV